MPLEEKEKGTFSARIAASRRRALIFPRSLERSEEKSRTTEASLSRLQIWSTKSATSPSDASMDVVKIQSIHSSAMFKRRMKKKKSKSKWIERTFHLFTGRVSQPLHLLDSLDFLDSSSHDSSVFFRHHPVTNHFSIFVTLKDKFLPERCWNNLICFQFESWISFFSIEKRESNHADFVHKFQNISVGDIKVCYLPSKNAWWLQSTILRCLIWFCFCFFPFSLFPFPFSFSVEKPERSHTKISISDLVWQHSRFFIASSVRMKRASTLISSLVTPSISYWHMFHAWKNNKRGREGKGREEKGKERKGRERDSVPFPQGSSTAHNWRGLLVPSIHFH